MDLARRGSRSFYFFARGLPRYLLEALSKYIHVCAPQYFDNEVVVRMLESNRGEYKKFTIRPSL